MKNLPEKYTIALAQIASKIGDLTANRDKHLELIEQAISSGASMIIFPELSLSGYLLRDLVSDVALSASDDFFGPIRRLSTDITIVCGGVELSDDFNLYNSVFVFEAGRLLHIHRKVYLPNYSVFEEKRFFGEGDRVRAYPSRLGTHGCLICNDMWHPSLLWLLNLQGVELAIVPSASPLRGLGETEEADSMRVWRLLCETGAKSNILYVAFVNQIGWQDGLFFWGNSTLYGPNGRAVGSASPETEELLVLEIDRDWLRRERIATPLRRDERVDLVARELAFIRSRHQTKPALDV